MAFPKLPLFLDDHHALSTSPHHFIISYQAQEPIVRAKESHWKNLPGAPNQCEINGHCLQSPNFPQNYGPHEGCLVKLPPFSVILVMAFSTEKRDMLVINGSAYSGDDDGMIDRSFVIRPETDVISWVTDGSGSLSGWQLCLDTPPACSDGFPVVPVAGEDCPSSVENLLSCETAALGALCIGDGTCHTRMDIDNCGQADIYRKMRPKSNGSTFPYDPIPVLVGSAPRPSLAESRWRPPRNLYGGLRRRWWSHYGAPRRRPPSYHRRRITSEPRRRRITSEPSYHRRRFASEDAEDALL